MRLFDWMKVFKSPKNPMAEYRQSETFSSGAPGFVYFPTTTLNPPTEINGAGKFCGALSIGTPALAIVKQQIISQGAPMTTQEYDVQTAAERET